MNKTEKYHRVFPPYYLMKQSKRRASPREQEEKEETRPHWKLKNGKAPHWHPCLTRPILPLWLASSSKQSWTGLHSSPEDFPAKLVFESAPHKYTKGPRIPLHVLLCRHSCFGVRRTARSLHFTGQLLCAEIHSLWLMENTELRAQWAGWSQLQSPQPTELVGRLGWDTSVAAGEGSTAMLTLT